MRRCIEAALTLHAARTGARTLNEREFRSLLGHEAASTDLVRLTIGMKMYGLLTTGRRGYALTDHARRLMAAQDEGEFRSLLFLTAMLPESVRELSFTYTARLDQGEVEQALAAANVPVRDRNPIFNVLMDNEASLQRERQYGTLYQKVQAAQLQQPKPGPLGWFEGSRRWLKTLPGRTANLTMVALLFAGSLLYVALQSVLTAEFGLGRSVTAPVPRVSVLTAARPADVPTTSDASRSPTALASNQASRVPSRETPSSTYNQAPRITDASPARPRPADIQAKRQPVAVQSPAAAVAVAPAIPEPEASLPSPSTPVAAPPEAPTRSPMARGRELTALLFSQQLRSVWGAFSSPVREEWGSYSAFRAYRQGGMKDFGAETSVISEAVRQSEGVSYYTRTALFERGPRQPWTVIFGLDRGGRVVAFNIVAAKVLPPLALASR